MEFGVGGEEGADRLGLEDLERGDRGGREVRRDGGEEVEDGLAGVQVGLEVDELGSVLQITRSDSQFSGALTSACGGGRLTASAVAIRSSYRSRAVSNLSSR